MSDAASLNPEGFAEGGGLIDDVDVTIAEARFDMFDYNGKVVPGVPALRLNIETDEDEEVVQYYSMGSLDDWMPSEDGTQILAVGKATSIRMTSNGGILLKSLVDAGFPADKLGDDISILDGLKCHMIRVPAPKRAGLAKADDGEKKFDATLLIVGEINQLPWEKKKPTKKAPAKKASAKKAAKKPAKEEADDGDVTDKATTTIMEILAEAGTLTKKELPGKLFQALKEDPDRNAIVKVAFDDTFLSDGPWVYEDGTLVG